MDCQAWKSLRDDWLNHRTFLKILIFLLSSPPPKYIYNFFEFVATKHDFKFIYLLIPSLILYLLNAYYVSSIFLDSTYWTKQMVVSALMNLTFCRGRKFINNNGKNVQIILYLDSDKCYKKNNK